MIDTIINDLETIATASASIETFIYDRVSAMNENRTKAYPVILVDSNPIIKRGTVNSEFLPRFKEYELRIFCFDLFQEAEKQTTDLQTKQAEIELILDQYIAEIISRTQATTTRGYVITNFKSGISGILAKDVHNNKLIMASYNITVNHDTQCEGGDFAPPSDCLPCQYEVIANGISEGIVTLADCEGLLIIVPD